METTSDVRILVTLLDTNLDADELEKETVVLLRQLREMDEVENVNRVLDQNPPDRSKPGIATLAGLLAVKVSVQNIKRVLGFLGDRLGDKPMEMTLELNGAKLTIKANSRREFEVALQAAESFVRTTQVANHG